jgi:hypothetical protein
MNKTRPPELAGLQLRGANILISWIKDYLVRVLLWLIALSTNVKSEQMFLGIL